MTTRFFATPVMLGVLVLTGIVLLLSAKELPAQGTECIAVDQFDMPRDCTFLEEHGECLWNALDSRDTCKDEADGFWDNAVCEVGVQVDLLACNFGLPWRLIKSIIN